VLGKDGWVDAEGEAGWDIARRACFGVVGWRGETGRRRRRRRDILIPTVRRDGTDQADRRRRDEARYKDLRWISQD